MKKMVVDCSITNEELEEKVKIAMGKYAEKFVRKNFDKTIENMVDRRIERLLSSVNIILEKRIEMIISSSMSCRNERMINDIMLEEVVMQKVENTIAEVIEKNAKDILANIISDVLAGK